MPLLKVKRSVEEEARRKASSAVRSGPKDIVQYDVDVNNLLLMHLSKGAREEAKKLEERFGGSALGARVALAAKFAGVKFVPSANSYAWTLEALERVEGLADLGYQGAVEAMLASQPWGARAVVVYEERGFSRSLGLRPLGSDAADRLAEDLSWFNSTPVSGYLAGIRLLDRLTDGDRALMLSTMRLLDDSVKAGGFRDAAAIDPASVADGFDAERVRYVYVDGRLLERPIFDGYTRVHLDDPAFERFDRAVEEELRRLAREQKLSGEKLLRVWEAVRDAVHAFAPAYYNFLGLDAETYVPKAVAKAVVELYRLYEKIRGIRVQRSRAPEDRGRIMDLAYALSDDSLEEFARTRVPYLVYRIGANLGTAFDLGKVYDYVFDNPKHSELAKLLLDLGVVVAPHELEAVIASAEANPMRAAQIIAELMGDPRWLSVNSVYAAFYGMGVPATRFLVPAAKGSRLSDRPYDYSMTFMTTTNLKLYIDEKLLEEKFVDPVTDQKVVVGKVFFGAVEKAIRNYINGLRLFIPGDELRPDNPVIYRGMLYIYSDRDLVEGYRKSIEKDRSPHTAILRGLQDLILNVELGDYIVTEYSSDVKKLISRGIEYHDKVYEYREKIGKVVETIESIEKEMSSLARIYNPKYVEYLGFASESVYKALLKSMNSSGGGGGSEVEGELGKKIAEAAASIGAASGAAASVGEVRRVLESFASSVHSLFARMEIHKHFEDHLRDLLEKRKEKRRKDYWDESSRGLPYFLELMDRMREEEQRRREEEARRQAEAMIERAAEEEQKKQKEAEQRQKTEESKQKEVKQEQQTRIQ